jgi:hypothetical protein
MRDAIGFAEYGFPIQAADAAPVARWRTELSALASTAAVFVAGGAKGPRPTALPSRPAVEQNHRRPSGIDPSAPCVLTDPIARSTLAASAILAANWRARVYDRQTQSGLTNPEFMGNERAFHKRQRE